VRVAHLTSVHPRDDVRIFRKQCRTLASAGYHTTLVVADGKGDQEVDRVQVIDVGVSGSGRLRRMMATTQLVYKRACLLDADLYHLHDPELLPVGLKLKAQGRRVIFDAHEDFPADIMTKPYLKRGLRKVIAGSFSIFENYACKKMDFVVTATPTIRSKFERSGCRVVDINNYPLLEELSEYLSWDERRKHVCYVGAMTSIRGVPQLVDAMALTSEEVRLALVGNFTEKETGRRCRESAGWSKVDDHGFVGRSEVRRVMENSAAGVVTFLPAPNHIDSQPNKMFEYMSAGIPVVGSDFPLWRSIIEGNECGLCVDPTKPQDVAQAIDRLCRDQEAGQAMGKRGREAVLARYNWDSEGRKLVELYKSILGH
jgi:glycosyltransferase involved in cell wall biosynthesis